jgi:hypothetical protein
MSEKVAFIVGTMEEIESAIRLYPNPAKETINIELKDITENVRVEVIDLRGHVLAGYSINGTSVIEHDIKNYEPSLYLVRLTTGKRVIVKKFSRI